MALDTTPHWEYVNNTERYGYWVPGVQSGYWDYSSGAGHYETTGGYWEGSNGRYEVTGSHMEMRGYWDYSAGFGHEEFRYTNARWEYDEYGNANFVEDTEVVWVEDPVWIEESVSVDEYTYVEDMVWVPGSEVWVDDPVYVDQSTPDSWVDTEPPGSPDPNPPVTGTGDSNAGDSPCEDLLMQIMQVRDELARRADDLRRDVLDLNGLRGGTPRLDGAMSVNGHKQQFMNKQTQLRNLLTEYDQNGCGGLTGEPSDAWSYATMPCPDVQTTAPQDVPEESWMPEVLDALKQIGMAVVFVGGFIRFLRGMSPPPWPAY
jgi:hypothetical protein